MELYKKILASTILLGTTFTGISKLVENIGEEVYRGEIDEYSVVYEEGKISSQGNSSFIENRMTLKKGDVSYIFTDAAGETDIDWKNEIKPNFEKDKLEKIILKIGDELKTYNIFFSDNLKYTIETKNKKEIFNKADLLYNSLREKIREELRNKYQQEQKTIIEHLKE